MKHSIFTVPTLTIGIKAKKALAKQGIKSKVIKNEGNKGKNGCAYALEFNTRDYYSVIAVLRNNDITYSVIGG